MQEERRGRRRRMTDRVIAKQLEIAKRTDWHGNSTRVKQPHRLAKQHAMDCGNPKCGVCGNPRQITGELTFQEKRFIDGHRKDEQ